MNKSFELIISSLGSIENIEDDKQFVMALIMTKCVDLLEFSQEMINLQRGVYIAPLLREVYEYTIVLIGLSDFDYLNQFVNHRPNDQFVNKTNNQISSNVLEKYGKERKQKYDAITKEIKATLSEHTHANIDNLIYYSLSKYSDISINNAIIEDSLVMYKIIQSFFLAAANSILKLENKIDNILKIDIKNLFQKLPNTEHANEVYKRIMEIDSIKARFINKIMELQMDSDS